MIKDKPILDVLRQCEEELNIPSTEVEKVFDLACKMTREVITNIDFENSTIEEFENTKKNFTFPGLIKLYVDKKIFLKINKI